MQGWKIKYYKGLGTSTAKEAKEYFADLQKNTKNFTYECEEDGRLIEMVFSKKHVDDRKRWLNSFQPGTFLDHDCSEIPYKDFINKELILFSRADLEEHPLRPRWVQARPEEDNVLRVQEEPEE